MNPADQCAVFAVAKDEETDRQIIHRKPRNIRERHIVGASKDLPHGVMLSQLPLEEDWIALGSVDDIKKLLPCFPSQ